MRSVLALAALAATATASATPWGSWSWGTKRTTSNCMSDSAAQTVANNFRTLIASYSDAFANETLTEDFIDYSDSVIELINGACTTNQNVPVRITAPLSIPNPRTPAALHHACVLHDFVHMLTDSLAARLCRL